MAGREVELHSHDFVWEDLARECRLLETDAAAGDGDADADSIDAAQLATEAKDKWDVFHRQNNGKVYKPRNYLVKEFPELAGSAEQEVVQVLELGCGYGSAIFPILAECPKARAQVCDFSAHAITILQRNAAFEPARCRAFVCDVAEEELAGVAPDSVDVALLVFVLSALPPTTFAATLDKVHRALRPGGVVCFRDYGLYDLAMRRSAKKLGPTLFYRSDGTLASFFSREALAKLFAAHGGFTQLELDYCTVRLHNRKRRVIMDRVWLHAKFQKTPSATVLRGST